MSERIKLSILIPTHNRPILFERCLNSILNQTTDIVYEIIVNNDSRDIKEIYHKKVNIKYFYENSYDISNIYKTLFDNAHGEFIYYLEDDDYLLGNNFFSHINFDYDINFINYIQKSYIDTHGPLCFYRKFIKKHKKLCNITDLNTFINEFDDYDFQLGQILFKKNLVKQFPNGNNLHNDYELFKSLAPATINYIEKQCWMQTADGRDNISFPEFNTDDRFK